MLSHRHHFVNMGTESLQAKVALLLLPQTFAQVPKRSQTEKVFYNPISKETVISHAGTYFGSK
jgi:hypothetical protein